MRLPLLLAALLSIGGPALGVEPELRVLALQDEPAPTNAGTASYESLAAAPFVDAGGRVLFRAVLAGPDFDFATRFWVFRTDESGDVAPLIPGEGTAIGLPAGVTRAGATRVFDVAFGRVLFGGIMRGPDVAPFSDDALFELDPDGEVRLSSAASGPGAPPGVTFWRYLSAALATTGPAPFVADLDGSAHLGVFGADAAGDLELLAEVGGAPPGPAVPGLVIEELSSTVGYERGGRIAFQGTQRFGPLRAEMIWGVGGGDSSSLVTVDQPAPGTEPPALFSRLGRRPRFMESGDLLFFSRCGVGTGIWQRRPDGTVLPRVVACPVSDPIASGRALSGVGELFGANPEGDLAFVARADFPAGSTTAMWRQPRSGEVELVARTGSLLPGRTEERLGTIGFAQVLNGTGDLLFLGGQQGGVNPSSSTLLFAPRGGPPILLVTEGDEIEVAPGDVRRVFDVRISERPFDENGRIAFEVRFVDETRAILVAEIEVTIDSDGDGVEDVRDNCPDEPNPDQTDTDGDLRGDACNDADDRDGDEIRDDLDNCPDHPNPDQADTDGDGTGDACNDADDRDGDEIRDDLDNCPDSPNPDQGERDGDGLGDACDPFPDEPDNEKGQLRSDLADAEQALQMCLERRPFFDADRDGEEDSTDACPETAADQAVDASGCSLEQFCTSRNPLRSGVAVFACLAADWQADEPLAFLARDCGVTRVGLWRFECTSGDPHAAGAR